MDATRVQKNTMPDHNGQLDNALWRRVLSLVLIVITLPELIIIMITSTFYSLIQRFVVRIRMGRQPYWLVAAADTLFLQEEPHDRADTVINLMLELRGEVDLDRYHEIISTRLVEARKHEKPPKLTSFTTSVFNRQIWIPETSFQINEHVIVRSCPVEMTEIPRILGDICSTSLPVDKSPWQFIIFRPDNGKKKVNRHFILVRMHHSIADGMSMMYMLLTNWVDEAPPPVKLPTRTKSSGLHRVISAFTMLLDAPCIMIARMLAPTDKNLIHGPKLSGTKLTVWSEPVALARIKALKNATHTTVNDVFLALVTSGMREYFQRHNAAIPREMQMYLPLNMRRMCDSYQLNNKFATVFIDLPTGLSDHVTLLYEIRRRTERLKKSADAIVSHLTMEFYLNFLPVWLTKLLCYDACRKVSMVTSNMPGPSQELRLAGNPMTNIIFWALPKANIGVTISMFSYRDQVCIGVMTDRAVVSDPEILCTILTNQVHKLENDLLS